MHASVLELYWCFAILQCCVIFPTVLGNLLLWNGSTDTGFSRPSGLENLHGEATYQSTPKTVNCYLNVR